MPASRAHSSSSGGAACLGHTTVENFHTFISSEPKKMSKNGPNLNGIFEKTEAFGDLMGYLHDISRYFLSENVALYWDFT